MSYEIQDITSWFKEIRYKGEMVDLWTKSAPKILTQIKFNSIESLIWKVFTELGFSRSDMELCSGDSTITARFLCNIESKMATPEEMARWKSGEITLFMHETTFSPMKAIPVNTSELKELGIKECVISTILWARNQ